LRQLVAAIHPFSRALRVKGGNQKAWFLVALSKALGLTHIQNAAKARFFIGLTHSRKPSLGETRSFRIRSSHNP
jgi:hypothetical protein